MTLPSRITEEARKLIDNGNCADCINDMYCACFERYCEALTTIDTAAEQRGREMAAQIADDYAKRAMDAAQSAQEAAAAATSIAAAIRSRTTEG